MSWNSIVGQLRVKALLKGALERNHLAHAFLFWGPEGAGQDAAAIELARTLNCSTNSIQACDQCADCLQSGLLQHPNIQLICPLPVGKNEVAGDPPLAKLAAAEVALLRDQLSLKAKNFYHNIELPKATSIKVNSIREIRKSASMNVFSKGKKVFIISEAHKMGDEAANALLKTLEEPLQDTYIILTTSDADRLLPTIVSRCQRVRFDPLSEADVSDALKQIFKIDPGKADLLAEVVRGDFSLALKLSDTDLITYRDDAVDLLRTILYKSREDVLTAITEIGAAGDRKDVEQALTMLQAWFHDAMTTQGGHLQHKHLQENATLRKFLNIHPALDYGRIHGALSEAISSISKNMYIPLVLMVLSFKLRAIILPRS